MADITTTTVATQAAPNAGVGIVEFSTAACDTGDTFDVVLAEVGLSAVKQIYGCVQTTAGSIFVQEQPTTSVTTGTLTVTVGGTAINGKIRSYLIVGN